MSSKDRKRKVLKLFKQIRAMNNNKYNDEIRSIKAIKAFTEKVKNLSCRRKVSIT